MPVIIQSIIVQLFIFIAILYIFRLVHNPPYILGKPWKSGKREDEVEVDLILFAFLLFVNYSFYNISNYYYKIELLEEYDLLIPLLVTTLMIFVAYKMRHVDISKGLRAEEWPNSYTKDIYPFMKTSPKEVSSIKNNSISTYPRFTFIKEENGQCYPLKNTFFDSSDFEVINKAVKTTEGIQITLSKGNIISLNNRNYVVEQVSVHFMSLFDDYSAFGHTESHVGIDTPYNIQIFVCLKEVLE